MTEITKLWFTAVGFFAHSVFATPADWLRQLNIPCDSAEIAAYFLICTIQIGLVAGVMRPLESFYPQEVWPDRQLTGIDRLYTLLKLLLVIPLFSFVVMPFFGQVLASGGDDDALLQIDRLFPALANYPLVVFLIYFVVYDFAFYVIHRLQHALPWWWGLHSLHHSQRQVSCWSNDRDHYLDDLFEMLILAGLGAVLGVAPVEYALLVTLGQLIEKFSHTNVRIGFGCVFEKILVDPHFHRLHHMKAKTARPGLPYCNFSLIFPIWDILFGTALYNEPVHPCGVDDPAIDADNDLGLIGQQAAGLRRFLAGFERRDTSV